MAWLPVDALESGMTLASDLKGPDGNMLLPKGIVKVQGDFERGDVVRIMTAEGRELARGISRYNASDMAQIAGKHSDDIESCLGYGYGAVAIHRDDLVLL